MGGDRRKSAVQLPKLLIWWNKNRKVKINDNNERRFGVVMTPFSSSKMKRINCQKKFA